MSACRPRALAPMIVFAASLAAASQAAAQGDEAEGEALSLEELLGIGQELWEEHAPPELQDEYRLPTLAEVEEFLAQIDGALAEGDVGELAAYAPEARVALAALRKFEGGDALADWLEPRLDFLDAAEEVQEQPPPPQPPRRSREEPAPPPPPRPQYTQAYWQETLGARPRPKLADRYMPVFKKAFAEKGVPPELAWLSEVESSLNLQARSPVGAYGPFQFMPATAERFGLRIGSPDERAHPRKSAEAAASYLKILYKRFGSWPLALAAYNAGEGRVGRALEASGASSFEQLSASLPAETRMYVPKVLATVAAREGVDPAKLPAAKL